MSNILSNFAEENKTRTNMKIFKISLSIALLSLLPVLTACHHDTLEDKAEKDCKEYTQRNCPTPFTDMQRTDSISFTRTDRTIHYYYSLKDKADDPEVIDKVRPKLMAAVKKSWIEDTRITSYKKAGFRFHFVYRSASTGKVLLEMTLPH